MSVAHLESIIWVDGWSALRPQALVRTLFEGEQGPEVVNEPLSRVRNRRAFEPSVAGYRGFPTRSVSIKHLELKDLYVSKPLCDELPRSFTQVRDLARQDIFAGTQNNQKFLIPAVLLIEALWLWSARATTQIMVPGSLDSQVGRVSKTNEIVLNRNLVSLRYGVTELRRCAWLAQCEDARRSWSSVCTFAHRSRLSLELPEARLTAWAWGIDVPSGLLVAELDRVGIHFDLPNPAATLRIGTARRPIPTESEPTTGYVTFL